MTPRERIEMIRMIELMNQHKDFCEEVGLVDRTRFQAGEKESPEEGRDGGKPSGAEQEQP